MPVYEFFLTSSLEKVFADQRPAALHTDRLNGLIGDRIAFQLVYSVQKNAEPKPQEFTVEVSGIDVPIRLRDVVLMPSHYPVTEKQDGNYLRTEPGLYPDLLLPPSGRIIPVRNQFRSLWIDADLSGAKPGVYRLCVTVRTDEIIMQELPAYSRSDRLRAAGAGADPHRMVPHRLYCGLLSRAGIFGTALGQHRKVYHGGSARLRNQYAFNTGLYPSA